MCLEAMILSSIWLELKRMKAGISTLANLKRFFALTLQTCAEKERPGSYHLGGVNWRGLSTFGRLRFVTLGSSLVRYGFSQDRRIGAYAASQ